MQYGAALALNARTIVEQFTWERSMTLFEDALLAATYCLSTIPGSLHGGEAIPSTPTKQLSLPPSKSELFECVVLYCDGLVGVVTLCHSADAHTRPRIRIR